MGKRGPQAALPGEVFFFAQMFYRDLRLLDTGYPQWRLDSKRLQAIGSAIQLTDEDRARVERDVDQKIADGQIKPGQRADRIETDEESELSLKREGAIYLRGAEARREFKVPGEPDILATLLRAKTIRRVQQICVDAFTERRTQIQPGVFKSVRVLNWPISPGSTLPMYLSKYAEQFLAAKNDPRYPRTDRPSSKLKQIWFLSRALAGAVFNLSPRTTVNLVGSRRPEEIFQDSRAAKLVRKPIKSRGLRGSKT